MFLFSSAAKGRNWLIAGLTVGICGALSLVGFWSYRTAGEHVTRIFDHYRDAVRNKWHLNVSYDDIHFTSNGAIIEGLKIDNGFQALIASLTVTWDINPLSKTFGNPATLQVTQFYAKTRLKEIPVFLRSLQEVLGRGLPGRPTGAEHRETAAMLPGQILVERGEVAISDDDNAPLLNLKGLSLVRDGDGSQIKIKADAVDYKGWDVGRDIQAELITAGHGQGDSFPLLVSLRHDGQNYVIKGEIARDCDSVKLVSKWRGLPFIPDRFKEHLALGEDSHFAASLRVVGLKDPKTAVVNANVIARHVGLDHPALTGTPVIFDKIKLLTRTRMDPTSQDLMLSTKLTLARQDENDDDLPGFDLHINLTKNLKEDWWGSYHTELELPSNSCETIKNSLPSALIAHIRDFELTGNAALKMSFDVDLNHPDAFIYQISEAAFGCSVVKAPEAYSTSRLTTQFGAPKGGFFAETVEKSPVTGRYVAIRDISPYVTSAMVASEDAGFFAHKGISWPSMLNALRRNLKDRSISLGGSTITMQMVKNLFLSRERTIGRKFEEIFLAWYVESILPKDKILEIYANIIEYGPDLYGIEQASRRFFNKPPAQITINEAAYIATLLPNPKGRYIYFCQNRVSENFRALISANMQKMYEQNMISDAELTAAQNERLRFADAGSAAPECQRNLASFDLIEPEPLRVEF